MNSVTDSYGNNHSNVLLFDANMHHYITFVLNKKYSFLKMGVSISENAVANRTGNLTVKADDNVIYTADKLSKLTEFFEEEIPINNCNLLTIQYDSDVSTDCIISNAVVYN